MSKAKDAIETLLATIDEVKATFEQNREAIRIKEQEQQDLLHEIEFANLDAVQRIQVFNRLRETRQERRRMKDENETLVPVYNLLAHSSFDKLKIELHKTRSAVAQILEQQSTRRYMPRAIGDLKIAGEHWEAEKAR